MNLIDEDEKDNENEAQNNFSLENNNERKYSYSIKSKEEQMAIAKEFLNSKISALKFAKQKKIGYSTLKKYEYEYCKINNIINKNSRTPYKKRFKSTSLSNSENLFKEVIVASAPSNTSQEKKPTHIEIVANNNIKLRMPGDTDINYLIKIIKGLSE